MLERLRRLLPGLWAGVLLCIAAIAAPAAFALLDRPSAGRVVGWLFQREAWLAVVAAALLLVIERRRAGAAAADGTGSVLSTEMLLLLGTLFCTVAGFFALQPLMGSARAGQGPLSFGQLHAISAAFFLAKLVMILVLAWRAAGRPHTEISRSPFS